MLGVLSTWIVLCSAIVVGFLRADAKLRPPYRALLSSWLRGETKSGDRWPVVISAVFDLIFRSRHQRKILGVNMHLPRFWRAVAASLLSVLVTTSLWFVLIPDTGDLFLGGYKSVDLWGVTVSLPTVIRYQAVYIVDDQRIVFMGKQIIVMLIIFPLLSNLVADYISLAESRFVLQMMARPGANIGLLILVDLLFTLMVIIFIGYISVVAGSMIFGIDFGYSKDSYLKYYLVDNILLPDFFLSFLSYFHIIPEYIEHSTYARQLSSIYGIFVYSTFLTSIWIWLFVLSRVLVRVAGFVPILFRGANKFFDLDEYIDSKPLWLMGWVLIGAATVGLAIFLLHPQEVTS